MYVCGALYVVCTLILNTFQCINSALEKQVALTSKQHPLVRQIVVSSQPGIHKLLLLFYRNLRVFCDSFDYNSAFQHSPQQGRFPPRRL